MSLNWTTLDPWELPEWMYGQQSGSDTLPAAYALAHPSELVAHVAERFPARSTAGGFSVRLEDDERMLRTVLGLVSELDGRRASRDEPAEEGGRFGVPTAVTAEYSLYVDGVQPVGPGGRITVYGRARRLEAAFHLRRTRLGGRWRDPGDIAREALAAFGGELTPDETLRAAFGYYEASGWEQQDLLRPVFVVLAERLRRDDEPRWRLASVHAASDVDEAPPTAGIESVTGCA